MAVEWFHLENGATLGPVPVEELRHKLREGVLPPETLVWTMGMPGWKPASTLAELSPVPPPPPPWGVAPGTPPRVPLTRGGLYPGAPERGFTEAIRVCLDKFMTFSGRASRSEYWYFVLFGALVNGVSQILDEGLHTQGALQGLVSLSLLLPQLAVNWRRLHDTDRSGWWIGAGWLAIMGAALVAGVAVAADPSHLGFGPGRAEPAPAVAMLVMLFGLGVLVWGIVLFVFTCQKGTLGPNRFG